jgi:hypothetical protein
MLKKFIFASFLTAIATSCFASGYNYQTISEPPANVENYLASQISYPVETNWYFGVEGGLLHASFNQSISESTLIVPTLLKIDRGATGGSAGAFFGIGWPMNNFYLGLEAFANYDSLKSTANFTLLGSNYESDLKITRTYGLDLIPGFLIKDQTILLYMRLGLSENQLKSEGTSTAVLPVFKKDVSGMRVGIGSEYRLSLHTGIRAEYIYNILSDYQLTSLGIENKISPKVSQFNLGFVVHI